MSRRAFTLVELLVVIAIMVLLTVASSALWSSFATRSRVPAAAQTVQSALLNAKQRAGTLGINVGVRFHPRTNVPGAYDSLSYVHAERQYNSGTVTLCRPDADGDGVADSNRPRDVVILRGVNTGWWNLKQLDLLTDGAEIRLPDYGSWYKVSTAELSLSSETLLLTTPYRDNSGFSPPSEIVALRPGGYWLRLAAASTNETILMPHLTVVDTGFSRAIPPHGAGKPFDILFSPAGRCTGLAASVPTIDLYVSTAHDAFVSHTPTEAEDNAVVTLQTQTGTVVVRPWTP